MTSGDSGRHRPGRERVERMLDEIEKQSQAVRESWQAGEAARLRMLAGQLAALAEGTGDTDVSELAAELEAVLIAEEAEASSMCERIESLILQCKKAAGAK